MLGARFAYLATAALLAAMFYPLSFDVQDDSFPLSNYTMFARGRKTPTLIADYMVALDAAGERTSIPPELVANAEVLQAQATIRQAIRRGKAGRAALCREVAARVAGDSSFSSAVEVEMIGGRYDAMAYLSGANRGGSEHVWVSCPVPRGAP